MLESTPLYGGNADYLEGLYEQYLADPGAVPAQWRTYFDGLGPRPADRARPRSGHRRHRGPRHPAAAAAAAAAARRDAANGAKQAAVSRLIQIWSNRGHLIAKLDPLGLMKRERPRVLELAYFGLERCGPGHRVLHRHPQRRHPEAHEAARTSWHRWRPSTAAPSAPNSRMSPTPKSGCGCRTSSRPGRSTAPTAPRSVATSCGSSPARRVWSATCTPSTSGQRRFSLEGGESLIPLLDDVIQQSGAAGVEEMVIGMAHRGRLNVLVNLLGKSPADIFSEFEGKYDMAHLQGSGDVKYHKGFSSDLKTPAGNMHVALAFNPSHLEVVNPVVEGSVRARQERRGDTTGAKVLPIQIHGDAAFAGQGVVTRDPAVVADARPSTPAARCTSSSTTRSASPSPTRAMRVRRCTARMSRKCSRRRSSTSTAMIRRRWCSSDAWPCSTARSSARTWSSTWCAIGDWATTRRMSRPRRSRACTR